VPHDADALAPAAGGGDATQRPRARVRSYVLRGGRLGSGQQRALAELGPRFTLPWTETPLDAVAVFGRRAPLVLEIGFGMGQATAEVAAAQPERDFIGVEVHEAGVGALLKLIGERGLANIRIVRHDAVDVVRTMIAPGSLAAIHIWFPDPWPKKRHHKRRLLQSAFVAELAARLARGGYLHVATDWQPYAEHSLEVLAESPLLANAAGPAGGYAPRPAWRPATRFEQRGLALGHGVWDLLFGRADSADSADNADNAPEARDEPRRRQR
jgi:tRNA (guanine-N7-)-methyltransferase